MKVRLCQMFSVVYWVMDVSTMKEGSDQPLERQVEIFVILLSFENEKAVWSVRRGNKRILFKVFSIQKITDMISSNHHLSLYTKLTTVLNE